MLLANRGRASGKQCGEESAGYSERLRRRTCNFSGAGRALRPHAAAVASTQLPDLRVRTRERGQLVTKSVLFEHEPGSKTDASAPGELVADLESLGRGRLHLRKGRTATVSVARISVSNSSSRNATSLSSQISLQAGHSSAGIPVTTATRWPRSSSPPPVVGCPHASVGTLIE